MTRWFFRAREDAPIERRLFLGMGASFVLARADAARAYHVDPDDLVLLAFDTRPL